MDLKTLVQLTRAEHSLMLVLAVWIGEIITLGDFPNISLALLSALPPFFIGLASFAINDYFDFESDKINKRIDRPLVRGVIKLTDVRAITMVCFAVGAIFSLFNAYAFALVLVFSFLAYTYSYKLKDLPLLGNLFIATSMAIPFVYGDVVASPKISDEIFVLSSIAFVAGVAREITKSVQDVKGDKKARRSFTLPVLIGNRCAIHIASFFYLLAIILSFIPYAIGRAYAHNFLYILPVLIADFLLFYIIIKTAFGTSQQTLMVARKISLLALMIGLAGFLVGSLFKI